MDVLPEVTDLNIQNCRGILSFKDINNANLLRPWLLKVKRKDPPVSKHSYLSSEHFSEDCFIRCVGGRRQLNYKIQFFTGGKAKAETSCLSLSCTRDNKESSQRAI